jgi:hypothetical protein
MSVIKGIHFVLGLVTEVMLIGWKVKQQFSIFVILTAACVMFSTS